MGPEIMTTPNPLKLPDVLAVAGQFPTGGKKERIDRLRAVGSQWTNRWSGAQQNHP